MTGPVNEATLVRELAAAFAEDRAPRFDRAEASLWARLIRDEIGGGNIAAGEHGLRHLRAHYPGFTFARRLGAVIDRLPLAGPSLPFTDDPARDVQVAARPGADALLLAYCGAAHNLGLPLGLMHCWLGRLDASVAYLRDFSLRRYAEGIASLGPDRAATLAALRGLSRDLGARRIVCFGSSAGSFGALHDGLDLGAEAVLATGAALDLRGLYAAAPHRPRVRLVFGADYWNDRIYVEDFAAVPGVILQPLAGFAEHNVVPELIVRDGLDAALQWLTGAGPHAAALPAPRAPTPSVAVPDGFAPPEGPGVPPGGAWRFVTPAQPWSYAATFALRERELRGPFAVRLALRVTGAPVGVGLLNADASDYEDRAIIVPADTAAEVRLDIENPVTSAGLVVQTAGAGGPATVEIAALDLLLPPDAQRRGGFLRRALARLPYVAVSRSMP
jgi:hypothetical protein